MQLDEKNESVEQLEAKVSKLERQVQEGKARLSEQVPSLE